MNQITLAEIAPVNPYFTAYCRHKRIKITDQFDTMDYMTWIHAKHEKFRKETAMPEMPGFDYYQWKFKAWLQEEKMNGLEYLKSLTDEQLVKIKLKRSDLGKPDLNTRTSVCPADIIWRFMGKSLSLCCIKDVLKKCDDCAADWLSKEVEHD